MNKKILIDFEKIKDPFSGLGQYCAHLKIYFDQVPLKISYWIPGKFQKLARSFPILLPPSKVFHATHQDSPYLPWSSQTKYILTIHDLNALYETDDLKIQETFKRKLNRKIKRADVITFISEFTKKEVDKYFDLKNKKTEIIYNGISLPHKSEVPKHIPKAKFIFSIGTIVPKKNFHVLIDFLKLLPEEYSIVLAGTTYHPYAQEMINRIATEQLSDRFVFVGKITDEEKRWYYENAAAFVFPSLFEGFGLPIAEAMSLGLPLFLSKETSIPEIGGTDAFYFDSFEAEKMAQVFLRGMANFTPVTKKRLIENSKKYNWETAANKYIEIYRSFL